MMNRTSLAVTVLALCAVSPGQSYVTSPAGFLSTEGSNYAYYFGAFASSRYMFFDGEYRNSLMIMKEVAYRLDGRNHTSYTAVGRSWKNVDIHMSECDYGNLGPVSGVFTLNATSTPSKVFSGSVSWGTQVGTPSSSPAQFDRAFPFGAGGTSSTYIHTGSKDICIDYDFSGGSLANGYSLWTSSSAITYYLDSYNTGSYGYNTQTYHGPYSSSGGCVDSGSTYTYGAYNYFYVYAYGPSYPTTSFQNKFRIYSYSYYTGPNAPVIHAYSILGSSTGTTFPGTSCQKLFLNPAGMILQASVTATSSGSSNIVYPTGTPNGLVPYIPGAAGVTMWQQCAWADTKSGQLKFTRGVETKIPALPKQYKRSVVYQYQDLLKPFWGYGPYDYYYMNPIARYTK